LKLILFPSSLKIFCCSIILIALLADFDFELYDFELYDFELYEFELFDFELSVPGFLLVLLVQARGHFINRYPVPLFPDRN